MGKGKGEGVGVGGGDGGEGRDRGVRERQERERQERESSMFGNVNAPPAVAFHTSLLSYSHVASLHCRHWTRSLWQHKCATSSDLLSYHLLHEVHGAPRDPPQPGLPSPLDCTHTPPLPPEPLI